MKLAAIDFGFLYTKAIVNHKRLPLIKSVVGQAKELRFNDLRIKLDDEDKKDHIIAHNVDGQDLFVSDLAIAQSDAIVHSLKANRFESTAIKALMQTVFGIGYGAGTHHSYIVSGLPVDHYTKFKTDITKAFMGEGGGTEIPFHIYTEDSGLALTREGRVKTLEGRFVPQPYGAAMRQILAPDGSIANKELARKVLMILDPGFGTTDVYTLDGMNPVESLTFSTTTAMNHAYKLIADKIEGAFGIRLPLYAVEPIARTGRYRKNGNIHDMTGVVQWAYQATAVQMVAELVNKAGTNINLVDEIQIAGGTGIALSSYLLPEFENIKLMEDAQWAVVEGYERIGRRTWKHAL